MTSAAGFIACLRCSKPVRLPSGPHGSRIRLMCGACGRIVLLDATDVEQRRISLDQHRAVLSVTAAPSGALLPPGGD
jgi:DNA-binding IclR family transcriptional regulator